MAPYVVAAALLPLDKLYCYFPGLTLAFPRILSLRKSLSELIILPTVVRVASEGTAQVAPSVILLPALIRRIHKRPENIRQTKSTCNLHSESNDSWLSASSRTSNSD